MKAPYSQWTDEQKRMQYLRSEKYRASQRASGKCMCCGKNAAEIVVYQDKKVVQRKKLVRCFGHSQYSKMKTKEYAAAGKRGTCILCHHSPGKICKSCANR